MPRFAVINNNIVENVIIANSLNDAEFATNKICVEFTNNNPAHIGMKWDETNGFEQPVVEETPAE
jgi:hypothetical protein